VAYVGGRTSKGRAQADDGCRPAAGGGRAPRPSWPTQPPTLSGTGNGYRLPLDLPRVGPVITVYISSEFIQLFLVSGFWPYRAWAVAGKPKSRCHARGIAYGGGQTGGRVQAVLQQSGVTACLYKNLTLHVVKKTYHKGCHHLPAFWCIMYCSAQL